MKIVQLEQVGALWVAVGPDFRAAGDFETVARIVYANNCIPATKTK